MTVHTLHHFNIRASRQQLLVLRDFYCQVIGLTPGPRPPFRSSGFWLYADGAAVLHLTVAPEPDSLPGVSEHRPAVEHVAFGCSDLEGTLERLRRLGIIYSIDTVPLVNEIQIFLEDPSGVGIELNFTSSESPVPRV